MLFSLDELEKIFPGNTYKQNRQILREIRLIKKAYRKQKGFLKSLKLTRKKILRKFSFYEYDCFCMFQRQDTMENWNEFVSICTEKRGAEFLEIYI